MYLCISNIWVPVNCQMPLHPLPSILCDRVHVMSSPMSIFSALMLGLCNSVLPRWELFFAEENFTSHGVVSHNNYWRFRWNFQTHMIWLIDDVSMNCVSQTTKCFMSKGKSTALTMYLPLLWQNLFDSALKWLPRCSKTKTDCMKTPVSFNCWFLL